MKQSGATPKAAQLPTVPLFVVSGNYGEHLDVLCDFRGCADGRVVATTRQTSSPVKKRVG
jgi:hypothetical protein